jgi:hypothetical protein
MQRRNLASYWFAASTISLLALTTACGAADGFKSAVPSKDNVTMRVPESQGQALVAGEIAPMYTESVKIATSVNLSVLWVFDVIDFIVDHPPTTIEENQAVWGPSEPRGLERLSFKFTVNKLEEQHFTYALEARLKGAADDEPFTEVFSGEAFPNDDNDGHGSLTYRLGSLRNLDPVAEDACLTGDIDVTYDAGAEPRTLDVVFTQVANLCNEERLTDAHYVYSEALDASGLMDFAIAGNIHNADENKPGEEVLSVRTRWLSTGAGRSDVRVSGDEIAADLAANIPGTTSTTVDIVQCWDDSFALVHADTTPDELEPALGNELTGESSACVIADASFSTLD